MFLYNFQHKSIKTQTKINFAKFQKHKLISINFIDHSKITSESMILGMIKNSIRGCNPMPKVSTEHILGTSPHDTRKVLVIGCDDVSDDVSELKKGACFRRV